MSFVVRSPQELTNLIKTVYELNLRVNIATDAAVPTPFNMFIWGPAGTGKTTTCINVIGALNLPNGYKILTCHPEMTSESLLGPIDIHALATRNELVRNVALGMAGNDDDVVIVDEVDVLPRTVWETFKSLLTSSKHCDAAGCYRRKCSLVIATSNASIGDVLKERRVAPETAEAIKQRFPIQVQYLPSIPFEEFLKGTTVTIPASIQISRHIISSSTIYYALVNKLSLGLRQVSQFFGLLTTDLEVSKVCEIFGIELDKLLGLLKQEENASSVRKCISEVETLLKALPTSLDTPAKVRDALILLGTDASTLPEDTLKQPAIMRSLISAAKQEYMTQHGLNSLPTCEDETLNRTLADLVSKLRAYANI